MAVQQLQSYKYLLRVETRRGCLRFLIESEEKDLDVEDVLKAIGSKAEGVSDRILTHFPGSLWIADATPIVHPKCILILVENMNGELKA